MALALGGDRTNAAHMEEISERLTALRFTACQRLIQIVRMLRRTDHFDLTILIAAGHHDRHEPSVIRIALHIAFGCLQRGHIVRDDQIEAPILQLAALPDRQYRRILNLILVGISVDDQLFFAPGGRVIRLRLEPVHPVEITNKVDILLQVRLNRAERLLSYFQRRPDQPDPDVRVERNTERRIPDGDRIRLSVIAWRQQQRPAMILADIQPLQLIRIWVIFQGPRIEVSSTENRALAVPFRSLLTTTQMPIMRPAHTAPECLQRDRPLLPHAHRARVVSEVSHSSRSMRATVIFSFQLAVSW